MKHGPVDTVDLHPDLVTTLKALNFNFPIKKVQCDCGCRKFSIIFDEDKGQYLACCNCRAIQPLSLPVT
jgi:hypothetical protein